MGRVFPSEGTSKEEKWKPLEVHQECRARTRVGREASRSQGTWFPPPVQWSANRQGLRGSHISLAGCGERVWLMTVSVRVSVKVKVIIDWLSLKHDAVPIVWQADSAR